MAFNSVFAWFIGKRMSRINYYRDNPLQSQQGILDFLFYNLSKTTFYKEIDNSDSGKHVDFFKIPLQNYETLQPLIARAMEGEENLLWPGKTNWFAKTSGTSRFNKKIIPVTQDSLENNHYANGKDLLAQYYYNLPNRKLFNAKHLIVGGTGEIIKNNRGVFIGDLSAIIIEHLPWWTEWRRTPAKEIALHGDWEHKLEQMAQAVIEENVCIIAGMPSWTSVLLQKILTISGKKTIHEVWPNLELYIHGGMSIAPYKENFKTIFGTNQIRLIESYNASEGYFGMQDKLELDDLLLMTNSNVYFEFIPMSEFEDIKSKVILKLEEVQLNTEYALVISTSAGLWRYIIGDTIKFTSVHPFRFVVTGRTTNFINAFGEKLIECQVEKTIENVSEKMNVFIVDYTVGPKFEYNLSTGRHHWLIEFQREPNNLLEFEHCIDEELKKLNNDYLVKREGNINIGKPLFTYLKPGSFKKWLIKNNKLGGQHKIPRLSNNDKIIEGVLNLQ